MSDTPETEIQALRVLRRGIAMSPELRRGLPVIAAVGLFAAVGRLIVPVMVQLVLDHGVLGPDGYRPGVVWVLSLAALAAVLVVAAASRFALIRLVSMAESALLGLRVRAFEHIHRLSLATHTESRRGVLVARVTSDIEAMAIFMQWGAMSWTINPVLIVATLAVMLFYSWQLTLLVLVLHLLLLPFMRWIQRRQIAAHARVRDRVADTMGHTSETVSAAAVIRAYGYRGAVRDRLDGAVDRQYEAQMSAFKWWAFLMPTVDLVSSVALAAALVVGVTSSEELGIGAGGLVAFVFLVRLLMRPISEIGEVFDNTQSALAAWWKVLGVLDTPVEVVEPAPSEARPLPGGPLAVEVRSVDFAYRTGGLVLRGVGVSIAADANVAVVGETGSGKTTFARLLARLADPTAGEILVGGTGLREVAPDARRRGIRMVPQDGFLFAATIEDNIRYGRTGATAADAEAAIDELGLREWLDGLPSGMQTPVGQRGGRLSVGERQLVALARAQVADPGLLILDEATSAVDPETEEALAVAMAHLAEGRTTVSVAHRLSTAERADLVLVFDDGCIVEQGRHDELVAAGGVYARLHESWVGNTRRAAGAPRSAQPRLAGARYGGVMNDPVRVAVTGAAGQIGYSLLFRIASGSMLGPDQPVILQMLEIPPAMDALRGVAMELDDCAFGLLAGTVLSDDPDEAFDGAQIALLVGSRPRTKGMERKDLLEANGAIFTVQGRAIAARAAADVRVLVVGNPANTNCLIAMNNAAGVPPERFTAMTRLDHNRAKAQLAARAGATVGDVTKMTIWGNHSATQYPDLFHCEVGGRNAVALLDDQEWLEGTFIPTVQQRGAAIIEARGASSAASAANAAVDHVRDWMLGTPPGDWVSMAVPSDGSYGVPEGLISSFPATCAGGEYQIVGGLEIDGFSRARIDASVAELAAERDTVASLGLI